MAELQPCELLDHVMFDVERTFYQWHRMCDAPTGTEYTAAFTDLERAMTDLASWHPRFHRESGVILPAPHRQADQQEESSENGN